MELVERIFYRKITPSDFRNIYGTAVPTGGGGQRYIEAAGIPEEELIEFLSYAEISYKDSKSKSKIRETRAVYTFNAYVIGKKTTDNESHALIEFDPRSGRNYRISRQNLDYRHPAWHMKNGFPEPQKDSNGNYIDDATFSGIIDNLVIVIVRTSYKKYYAYYINDDTIPDNWPIGIGLENIYKGERRGIINLSRYKVQFTNNPSCPFNLIKELDRKQNGSNVILYGVPGSGKSWTIEHEYCSDESKIERLVFHPDYMYSDFIGQILPVVVDDKVRYQFTPGPFTKLLKKAYNDPENMYYLIIEEINRGNAPAIFGEVFQLLDRITKPNDDYPIGTSEYGITNANIAKEVYGDAEHKVRIPSNLSLIGTMNTSDQNVFTLDTAFQRRWIMRMIPNSFKNHSFAQKTILDTTVTWENFCHAINNEILRMSNVTSSEDKRLGAYFINESDLGPLIDESALADKPEEQIKAHHKNSIFAEKVLKYLWDDAFKFNHNDIFNSKKYKSLESLIDGFMSAKGNKRFNVFNDNLKKAIINGVNEEGDDVHDNDSNE